MEKQGCGSSDFVSFSKIFESYNRKDVEDSIGDFYHLGTIRNSGLPDEEHELDGQELTVLGCQRGGWFDISLWKRPDNKMQMRVFATYLCKMTESQA